MRKDLNRQEIDLLRLRSQGLTFADCSLMMGKSVRTVHVILSLCKEKLNAQNEAQAVTLAIAKGLIEVPKPH